MSDKPPSRLEPIDRRAWLSILVAAIALRSILAFGIFGSMPMVSDAASYVEAAEKFVHAFPGGDTFYWPPGMPLLLAGALSIFGSAPAVARAVAIALGTLVALLTMLVARELGLSQRAVRATGWIATFYVPSLFLAGQSYSQHLASVCILGFAWLFARTLQAQSLNAGLGAGLGAGLFLGAGCLTRPSMLSLVALVPIATFFSIRALSRKRSESTDVTDVTARRRSIVVGHALCFATAIALISPAALHNHKLGAGFTISTNNDRNFFLGNNPHTPLYKTSHLGQRALTDLDSKTRSYLESFYRRPDARAAMRTEAIAHIKNRPDLFVVRSLNRATSFWGFDYLGSRLIQEHYGLSKRTLLALLGLEAGAYLIVAALALFSFVAFRQTSQAAAITIAIVLFYEGPYVLAFSGGTYHYPAALLLIPFAVLVAERLRAVGIREALGAHKVTTLLALTVFCLLQLQYAYYALKMS